MEWDDGDIKYVTAVPVRRGAGGGVGAAAAAAAHGHHGHVAAALIRAQQAAAAQLPQHPAAAAGTITATGGAAGAAAIPQTTLPVAIPNHLGLPPVNILNHPPGPIPVMTAAQLRAHMRGEPIPHLHNPHRLGAATVGRRPPSPVGTRDPVPDRIVVGALGYDSEEDGGLVGSPTRARFPDIFSRQAGRVVAGGAGAGGGAGPASPTRRRRAEGATGTGGGGAGGAGGHHQQQQQQQQQQQITTEQQRQTHGIHVQRPAQVNPPTMNAGGVNRIRYDYEGARLVGRCSSSISISSSRRDLHLLWIPMWMSIWLRWR